MNTCFPELFEPFPFQKQIRASRPNLLDYESLAKRHNIQLLYYAQLERYKKETGPDSALDDFLRARKQTLVQAVLISLAQRAIEKETISLLNQATLPAVILKGTAIAKDIYHNINSRISCDIDLLVKESDIERIDNIMKDNGYIYCNTVPLSFLRYRLHHATYAQKEPRRQIPIEIHWNFSIPGFFRLSSQQIWHHVKERDDKTLKLSAQMTLVFLLMHHHRHAFKELRNLIDIYWAIHTFENEIDWPAFAEDFRRIGLCKSIIITITQIERLWPEGSERLTGLKILKRAAGRFGSIHLLLPIYPMIKQGSTTGPFGIKDKILYRLALDRWGSLLFSFYKSVFPSPAILRELYKDQSDQGLIAKYLRYLRWRFRE